MIKEMPEVLQNSMGLYDSGSPDFATVVPYKAIDITEYCPQEKQVIIKYADVVRGKLAQICIWYEKGKDMGTTVHWFLNETTPEDLAKDSVLKVRAMMMGIEPLILTRIMFDNQ